MASTDKLVITQSWLNKNKKGESHHEHVHPNSMVSGVWYPQIHEHYHRFNSVVDIKEMYHYKQRNIIHLIVQHLCYL